MSEQKILGDLPITVEDFEDCGWREILSNVNEAGYLARWSAFLAGARKASEEGRLAHAKVLNLLAAACSLDLKHPQSQTAPFCALLVFPSAGRRSPMPDDFSDADILFFSQILEQIDDIWLRARLADLIRIKIPDNAKIVHYSLIAIDNYRSISLDAKTLRIYDGGECWSRAITLARNLQKNAGNRLKDIEDTLINTLFDTNCEDKYLILEISILLLTNKLAYHHSYDIGEKLEYIAKNIIQSSNHLGAQEFLNYSMQWFKKADDNAKFAEITALYAETWITEAESKSLSDTQNLSALHNYNQAIQLLYTIPKKNRNDLHIDERIASIRLKLNEAGKNAVYEIKPYFIESIDISSLIKYARDAVTDKTKLEAFKAFINIYPGVKVTELHENAVEQLKKYPLLGYVSREIISEDGRVIARFPKLSIQNNEESIEEDIQFIMSNDYIRNIDFAVKSVIMPALETMHLEYQIHEDDFIGIALHSPIVPRSRIHLFGRALFAGYNFDFTTSIYLLTPQLEQMVRAYLKAANIQTTTLDKYGIENEIGLSNLIKIPESKHLFGDDFYFEFDMLYCESYALNLRNLVAHGLLSEEGANSTYAIYAWWFALKLISIPAFFNVGSQSLSKKRPGTINTPPSDN